MAKCPECNDEKVTHHGGEGVLGYIRQCSRGCGSIGWDVDCADDRELERMATDLTLTDYHRGYAQRVLTRRRAQAAREASVQRAIRCGIAGGGFR